LRLPTGRYFFVAPGIGVSYGGLTASMLARARSFGERADQPVTIALFGPVPRFGTLAEELVSRGVIPERGVTFRSLHHDLCLPQHAGPASGPFGAAPADVQGKPVRQPEALDRVDVEHVATTYREGQPWQIDLRDSAGTVVCREHRRPDGSPYLRQHLEQRDGKHLSRLVEHIDGDGTVRTTHASIPSLYRSWFAEVLGAVDEVPKFSIVDGAMASKHLLGLQRPDLYRIFVVHNTHIAPPGRYDGELKTDRAHMFRNIDALDALVVLTDRQRQDVALRCGSVNNLFTVPHAAYPLPDLPDPSLRSSRRVVVLSRLDASKRVSHIIHAFARVTSQVPDAVLDIYGSGPQRQALEELADELGTGDSVRFHGFDRSAAAQFQTATFFVMASLWEGQPLTILEAMGSGCPVISYDIKYGPADAIEHGGSGLLVTEGDIDALAASMLRLLNDTALAQEMSLAAWKRSHDFDDGRMMSRWQGVFERLQQQRRLRTKLKQVDLVALVADRDGDDLELSARLMVTGDVPADAMEQHRWCWMLISRETAEQVRVEAESRLVSHEGGVFVFEVGGRVAGETVSGMLTSKTRVVDLSLDLTWNNSHWRGRVQAPPMVEPYATNEGNLSFRRTD
jgi:poly(glycerol-phosphate) alpha-glucosyltransferase